MHQITGGEETASPNALELPGKAILQQIWRRKWLVAACAGVCVTAAAVNAYFIATPIYRSSASIFIEAPAVRGDAHVATGNLETQSVVISSTAVFHRAWEKCKDLLTLEHAPFAALKAGLHASVGKEDDIITVTFDGPYEEETQQILAAVVEAYKDHIKHQQQSSAKDLLDNLTREKEEREKDLQSKQAAMLAFQRNAALGVSTSADPRDNLALKQLQTLADAVTAQQLEVMNAMASFEESSTTIDDDTIVARRKVREARATNAITLAGTDVEQLRSDLFTLQQRQKLARQQYLPDHPSLKALAARIEQFQLAYVSTLEQRATAAERKLDQLRDAFDAQQRVAVEVNAKSAELMRLQMDVTRVEKTIDVLDERIKDINVDEITPPMNVVVIEDAKVVPGVVSPKKKVALFQGLMVGLLLGSGLTFLDRRFRSIEELRSALKLPLLGVIPRMERQPIHTLALHVRNAAESVGAHAYRAARTQLTFGTRDREMKTLLLTSPSTGEGKTAVACNLAIAFAQAGHKTLLIDANLRQPILHDIFGVDGRVGLTDILQGNDSIEHASQATDIDSLDLMPAGAVAADPSELLNSPELSDVLNMLAGKYDYVLIDSTAVTRGTDARVLGAMCDGTLLVIDTHLSNRATAVAASEALTSVGATLVGVVLNNAPRHGWSDSVDAGFMSPTDAQGTRPAPSSPAARQLRLPMKQRSA